MEDWAGRAQGTKSKVTLPTGPLWGRVLYLLGNTEYLDSEIVKENGFKLTTILCQLKSRPADLSDLAPGELHSVELTNSIPVPTIGIADESPLHYSTQDFIMTFFESNFFF